MNPRRLGVNDKLLRFHEPLRALLPDDTAELMCGRWGGAQALRAALADPATRRRATVAAQACPRMSALLAACTTSYDTSASVPPRFDEAVAVLLEALAARAPPRGAPVPLTSLYSVALHGWLDRVVLREGAVQCLLRRSGFWEAAWLVCAGGVGIAEHALLAYTPKAGDSVVQIVDVLGVWDVTQPPPPDGWVALVTWATPFASPPLAHEAQPKFLAVVAAHAVMRMGKRRAWAPWTGERRVGPPALGVGGWVEDLADVFTVVIVNVSNWYSTTRARVIAGKLVLEAANQASARLRNKVRARSAGALPTSPPPRGVHPPDAPFPCGSNTCRRWASWRASARARATSRAWRRARSTWTAPPQPQRARPRRSSPAPWR